MKFSNRNFFISAFVKHISCPLVFKRDGLGGLFYTLKELEESQYWSKDLLRELQFERLKRLLIHSYNNCTFYRNRLDDAGLDPENLKDIEELKKIPTLSKKDIRENLDSLIAKNYKGNEWHSAETGGTTGVKMKFFRDNACLTPKEAALYRYEKWAGWNFGERIGIVWTAQQDYVGNWTFKSKIKNALSLRQVVFPAAIMDEESISNYVDKLISTKPTMIRAFSSPIFEVARYITENRSEEIKLKGVITTGEPLYKHQREVISSAFNCEVFDSYRTREVGTVAQECEKHRGMHINAESIYVETLETKNLNHFEEGLGEIVITDLLNYGMPLIRYRMGDMGILSNDVCSCGRGLPILKYIAGRTADTLFTPEKKKVTAGSLVLYLIDEAPGMLGQVQIIQDELDHLIIKTTNDPPPTLEIVEYQKKTVKRLFGDRMRVTFEQVDEIPFEKSGKYRFTICKLSKADM